ncbi:hypothetical protein HPB49_003486 [Dermacentor silvarum]|uniref:Uncharacterized protein n=1 Tax=Dermacentor silvarum TaxID=543639 RepID=A0ACB8C781_DERSI|nr:hypothetical protein HPB49_003486 [Dermacentor silvarum]
MCTHLWRPGKRTYPIAMADQEALAALRHRVQHLQEQLQAQQQKTTKYVNSFSTKRSVTASFMRALAGSTPVDDSLLRIIWLDRLPFHAQAIHQVQPNLPLDQLAEIADRVVEASPPPPPLFVHAAGASKPTPELASRIDEIARHVDSIQRHLDQRPTLPGSSSGRRPQISLPSLKTTRRGWFKAALYDSPPADRGTTLHHTWRSGQQRRQTGEWADVSKGEENKDTFWEFSDATAETPTAAPAASEAAPPVRRYPVRNRRAPDRYTPS